jgi:ribosomal protein S14
MKILYIKDKNQRNRYYLLEKKKLILQYVLNNLSFTKECRNFAYSEYKKFSKFSNISKIKNRCVFSNRSRSIYRQFKLSRIFFKKLSLEGYLMGVKKAS